MCFNRWVLSRWNNNGVRRSVRDGRFVCFIWTDQWPYIKLKLKSASIVLQWNCGVSLINHVVKLVGLTPCRVQTGSSGLSCNKHLLLFFQRKLPRQLFSNKLKLRHLMTHGMTWQEDTLCLFVMYGKLTIISYKVYPEPL